MEALVIEEVERVLRNQCASLDPDSVPLPEAPDLYLRLVAIGKLANGAATRLLARVDAARPGAAEGKRSTADWDAEKTGTTPGAARAKLDTSKRLHEQPGVDEALARGELSGEQANAISDATDADPSAEKRLLGEARSKSVKDLRKECDRVKANAHPDPAARRRAIHAGRFARTWTDAEGGRNIHLRGLSEDLAFVEAVAAKFRHAAFEAARKAGRREHPDAISYDGYLALLHAALGITPTAGSTSTASPTQSTAAPTATTASSTPAAPMTTPASEPPTTPQPSDIGPFDDPAPAPGHVPAPFDLPPPTTVAPPKGARLIETKTFIHIDFETLRRGRTHPGTLCDIDGYGRVDLDWVRKHIGESFVVLLLKDGPRIIDLIHAGRTPTAEQRSAKEAEGIHCNRPGCDQTHNLELHHVHAWSPTRETVVRFLAWLCPHDHDLITLQGHQLHREPDGTWTWHTPHDLTTDLPAPPDNDQARPPPPEPPPPGSAAPPEPGPRPTRFADPDAA